MSAHSVFTLLRLPFSFLLAPIALIGLALSPQPDLLRSLIILGILHLIVYPASNGYNSWCDKDTGPIGGIEHPPLVTRGLLYTCLILDISAVLMGLWVSVWFSFGLLAYILASRAYSWPQLRFKSRPIVSLLLICIGQGSLVFLLVRVFAQTGNSFELRLPAELSTIKFWNDPLVLGGLMLSALFLAGIYPLGQVYQHVEDKTRGDLTYSRLLGIRATFLSSAIFLSLALGGLAVLFLQTYSIMVSGLFLACVCPAAIFFFRWWWLVTKDERRADFKHLMILNISASTGMNLFLILMVLGLFRP